MPCFEFLELHGFLLLPKYVRNTSPWNVLFSHTFPIPSSLSPCFGDITTDVKTYENFLFLIWFSHKCLCETLHWGNQPILFLDPTQYQHFGSLCHGSISMYTVEKSRWCLLRQCFNCNIPMNMPIGYNRYKCVSVEVYLRRFSTAFITSAVKNTHWWLLSKWFWSSC